MTNYHTRTIKLKLRVINKDEAGKKTAWKRIRQISNDVWKAANWIASGQYLNDQIVRRIYARRQINAKEDKESVQKIESEWKEFFGTKRQATTERDIKEAFPNIPPCVTNPLNQVVVSSYNKEKREMLSGNRALRTYRRGTPMQTTKAAIKITGDNKHHNVTWTLGRKEQIQFEIYYGKDRANNRLTVSRILEGKNDYSAPQIQLKDKDLFLLLPVKEPQHEVELDSQLSLGVDLGVAVPAYVALSKGEARRAIGSKKDFLKVRVQMQKRRQQLQRSLKAVKGGKGRQKKLKALEHLKVKERNFSRSYNHFISREVVDFAIRNGAGVIKTEMLEGFGQDEQHAFILRNWSYFELQTMIEYKAKRSGITVVKIDPYHTSQNCSVCGNYDEGQRKSQEVFACTSCDAKLKADYNAAVNIARSEKVVTKKEQCEYFKNTQKEISSEALA